MVHARRKLYELAAVGKAPAAAEAVRRIDRLFGVERDVVPCAGSSAAGSPPFPGPPGTGKSHLATALGVAAVRAGRSVYRATLAEIMEALGRAEREGRLAERLRSYARPALLIVDEIGYLPITAGGANLFFQLVNIQPPN